MPNCAECGTTHVTIFDDGFREYFCDTQCHRDYCADNFEAIYKEWADVNVMDADND